MRHFLRFPYFVFYSKKAIGSTKARGLLRKSEIDKQRKWPNGTNHSKFHAQIPTSNPFSDCLWPMECQPWHRFTKNEAQNFRFWLDCIYCCHGLSKSISKSQKMSHFKNISLQNVSFQKCLNSKMSHCKNVSFQKCPTFKNVSLQNVSFQKCLTWKMSHFKNV